MNWGGWVGCTACTTGPREGARHLLAWLLETVPIGRSQGIFNCREVRGSTSLSIHSCGRAVDFWLPYVNGTQANPAGHDLVRRLGTHGKRLGIQTIIWNRTIWSARSPEGRPYTGVHPHYDHLHIELTPAAADRLTLATLRHVLEEDLMPDPRFTDEVAVVLNAMAKEIIRLGSNGRDFARWLTHFWRTVRDIEKTNPEDTP